jgi:hypothetical protein
VWVETASEGLSSSRNPWGKSRISKHSLACKIKRRLRHAHFCRLPTRHHVGATQLRGIPTIWASRDWSLGRISIHGTGAHKICQTLKMLLQLIMWACPGTYRPWSQETACLRLSMGLPLSPQPIKHILSPPRRPWREQLGITLRSRLKLKGKASRMR